jgi:hypothetical protein
VPRRLLFIHNDDGKVRLRLPTVGIVNVLRSLQGRGRGLY